MQSEFRAFLLKTNVLAHAVGVIIGVALGAVVNWLVNDIIMPPIGMAFGGIVCRPAQNRPPSQRRPGEGGRHPRGGFLNTVIAFVVIAFVVFLIGRRS